MLSTVKGKGLLWPAVMTLAGLAILVSLGNWQMRRLAWKEGLIAAIAERKGAAPVSVSEVEWRANAGGDIEYTRVKAAGRLLNDKELHLYAFDEKAGPGYHVITPLQQADGSVVLVNRGYVPQDLKDPATRQAGQLTGDVEITGLARRPGAKGTFDPDNDAAKNIWYWRDLVGMAAAAVGTHGPRTVPFFIDAEAAPEPPGGWPKGGVTRLELPNRHLEYALTWYGLAAALAAVFAAFAITRWRQPAQG
jgi:surfeit locus 1 family protein